LPSLKKTIQGGVEQDDFFSEKSETTNRYNGI